MVKIFEVFNICCQLYIGRQGGHLDEVLLGVEQERDEGGPVLGNYLTDSPPLSVGMYQGFSKIYHFWLEFYVLHVSGPRKLNKK